MKYEHLWASDDNTQLYGYVPIQNNKLPYGFDFLCLYFDDLLILPRGDWENH